MMSDDFDVILEEMAFRLECVSIICRTIAKRDFKSDKHGIKFLKSMIDIDDIKYMKALLEVINDK